MKSTTPVNASQQIRLGLGQVLEYRFVLQRRLAQPVRALLAVPTSPSDLMTAVCGAAGVTVITGETLADDLSLLIAETAS